MKKNGSPFLSLIEAGLYRRGTWDPYAYRDAAKSKTMGHFVEVSGIRSAAPSALTFSFGPIEYAHIHKGTIPTFSLTLAAFAPGRKMAAVGEASLLFGTMRAYLGNVLVTPLAAWIGEASPLLFPVKSEFVKIVPKDNLHYFWWAFLQSSSFLNSLPVGSGGTRPRLLPENLLRTPVAVPSHAIREKVHRVIHGFAQRQWQGYTEVNRLLSSAI